MAEPTFPQHLGGFDGRTTPALHTDVLVLGTGLAGAAAALHAAEAGAAVLLLGKSEFAETNTGWAQGGLAAVMGQDDSATLHLEDTLRVGSGLADSVLARSIIAESTRVVAWLQGLGVELDRDAHGTIMLSREGGHSVDRVVHHGDATGVAIQAAIRAAVTARPEIVCRTDAFCRDLLVRDGRCVGAVVLLGSTVMAVEAGAVVVATGGAGQIYRETTNPIGSCGDGLALCLRAGAQVADMEFVQFHPTTLYIAGASRFLISEVVRGAGALLRDRNGVRFMPAVHPAAELAPRDVVSRAILERMVATGDTHVYLDLSPVSDPHARFPTISRICRAFDIDIARNPIPVRPGAHYMIGGVACDAQGSTGIDGLLVAGEVACSGFHGANRLASNSLLEGAVLGQRAGIEAAMVAARALPGLPKRIASRPPVDNAPRIHLDDMLYALKNLMWRNVGLVRTDVGLADAAERIGMWHRYLIGANPSSRAAFELANMLTVAALVTAAAQQRQESRGTHFRADFAARDDEQWCRHIVLARAANGQIELATEPLLEPSDRTLA